MLQDGWTGVWILAGVQNFSFLQIISAGSTAHQAFTPPSVQWVLGFFPIGEATRAGSWPLPSTYRQGSECVELYF